jgi:hypothetical protein
MSGPAAPEPSLLKATAVAMKDRGAFEWDAEHNADTLSVSNSGRTIEWGPRKPEYEGMYPPAWVPAQTRARLHSGRFQWDFVVEEMAEGQIGIGFMLLWDLGPDWGFFGYLGASSTAWAYDLSTGDVVCDTRSIEGGLPTSADGHTGIVTVHLELPRQARGKARFSVDGVDTRSIELPEGAVILPAACLLRESQKVTLSGLRER